MTTVLLVGGGGFLGSIVRYGISRAIQRGMGDAAFPYGTFAVNMIGCLLIGLVLGIIEQRADDTSNVRAFVVIGILGGFTTFSAFGYDTLLLFRDSRAPAAMANLVLQPALGLLAAWAGWQAAKLG